MLKKGLRKGVPYYDSATKAGKENEILFYVELKEGSKLVFSNFTEIVKIKDSKEAGKRYFDLTYIKNELMKYRNVISSCEV